MGRAVGFQGALARCRVEAMARVGTASNRKRLSMSLRLEKVAKKFALCCCLLGVAPATANADLIAGFNFNTANSFTSASVISGSITSDDTFNVPTTELNDGGINGEPALTLGRLLGYTGSGASAKRRVTLGDVNNSNTIRTIVELGLPTGMGVPNLAGNDLVVFEQGSANAPEAFAISVRVAGSLTFSDYRYEIWDASQVGTSSATIFGTAFDLSSFGLAAGASIDAIRIMNLRLDIPNGVIDYTPLGGEGTVVTGAIPPVGYALPTGYGPLKNLVFNPGDYDPDIGYVGVLQNLAAVPEASSFAFFGLVGVVAYTANRFRKARTT
jgi:hypothetical protein